MINYSENELFSKNIFPKFLLIFSYIRKATYYNSLETWNKKTIAIFKKLEIILAYLYL